MFFALSKIFAFLIIPSNIVLGLGIVGLALTLTRRRRTGVRLVIASFLLLLVVGLSPLGSALIWTLENRFPPWKDTGGPVSGIVVLGGVIDAGMTKERGSLAISGSVERMTEAAALARRYPAAKVVFTGGDPRLFEQGAPEAELTLALFDLLGVPRERIVLEDRSRNTEENARFTKELVRPKPGERWLLVTSAAHMPRSVGVFRKAQFSVEPYPVDWSTAGRLKLVHLPQRLLGGWSSIDNAAHEWIGLLAYWITGRTSELFPGPGEPGARP